MIIQLSKIQVRYIQTGANKANGETSGFKMFVANI